MNYTLLLKNNLTQEITRVKSTYIEPVIDTRTFKEKIFGGLVDMKIEYKYGYYNNYTLYVPVDLDKNEWSWGINTYSDISAEGTDSSVNLRLSGEHQGASPKLTIWNKDMSESHQLEFHKYGAKNSDGEWKVDRGALGNIFQTYEEGIPDIKVWGQRNMSVKIGPNEEELIFGMFVLPKSERLANWYEIRLDDEVVYPITEIQDEAEEIYLKWRITIPQNDTYFPKMHVVKLVGYTAVSPRKMSRMNDTSYAYVYQLGKPIPEPTDINFHEDIGDSGIYYHFKDLEIDVPDGEYTYYIVPDDKSTDPQNAINTGLLRVGDVETKRNNTEYYNDRKYKEYTGE